MKNFIIMILIVLLGIFLFQNFFLKKDNAKFSLENETLTEDLKNKVVVSGDTVKYITRTIVEKSSDIHVVATVQYYPPEGKLIIENTVDGETKVIVKNKGFTLEPALSFIADFESTRAGLGSRFIFFNRFGLGGGLSINLDEVIRPYVHLDYRISSIFPILKNTTVGIVYTGNVGLIVSVFL